MNEIFPACCICETEADWVRMRMPNGQQMNYLCHRHHAALKERNPVLAAYYDRLSSTAHPEPKPSSLLPRVAAPDSREDYTT